MTIITELNYLSEQRVSQIASIRTLPDRYSFSADERQVHYATTVVIIYANWEGFVKESIKIYLEYLNRQECRITDLSDVYYAYLVNQKLELRKELTSLQSIISYCQDLRSSLDQEIAYFNPQVNAQGNANCKNVNSLFERLGIGQIVDKSKYSKNLDKLLLFRHSIAHGSNSISVSSDQISDFSSLVEELMGVLSIALEKAVMNRVWLKNSSQT